MSCLLCPFKSELSRSPHPSHQSQVYNLIPWYCLRQRTSAERLTPCSTLGEHRTSCWKTTSGINESSQQPRAAHFNISIFPLDLGRFTLEEHFNLSRAACFSMKRSGMVFLPLKELTRRVVMETLILAGSSLTRKMRVAAPRTYRVQFLKMVFFRFLSISKL